VFAIHGAMIRVVLDTNILISALLNPQGLPAQVFLMTIIDPDTETVRERGYFCRV
jgi:predicted nucleic acid-binding protein